MSITITEKKRNTINCPKDILDFWSDRYEDIRNVLGIPDDSEFYIITLDMAQSDDPVEKHIFNLKTQHNLSLAARKERKYLMDMGILDVKGRLIERELPDDMKSGCS